METEKMIIYIMGSVSSRPDTYNQEFEQAHRLLRQKYPQAEIINPVRYMQLICVRPEELSWEICMLLLLSYVVVEKQPTHCWRLEGWEQSSGAQVEHIFFDKMGVRILNESDK